MATMFETPAQYERDIRGASKEWRRGKNSAEKWAIGARPLAGVRCDMITGELSGGNEAMLAKVRPRKKHSNYPSRLKKGGNVGKATRGNPDYRHVNGRASGRLGAQGEIEETSRSILDLLVPQTALRDGIEGVLYSYDTTETPGLRAPVGLDLYVKTNPKTTERFVEKEYEIVDTNGDLLKGRKARRDLRKSAGGPSAAERPATASTHIDDDDDDFELL
ncbi:hypothetical protein MCOR34_004197 [Pyricularia oryzae]|nr:hypothetical protein MCOR34_004197 [Pyricularia oryzae]